MTQHPPFDLIHKDWQDQEHAPPRPDAPPPPDPTDVTEPYGPPPAQS